MYTYIHVYVRVCVCYLLHNSLGLWTFPISFNPKTQHKAKHT